MNKELLRNSAVGLENAFDSTQLKNEAISVVYSALRPFIEKAKSGSIEDPVDDASIPGNYQFVEGELAISPEFQNAYVDFRVNLRGGLTPKEQELINLIEGL